MQRGLWGQPAQYKLQVDKGRVSCRVLGSKGEAFIVSRAVIRTQTWYTAQCERKAGRIVLKVKADGGPTNTSVTNRDVGALRFPTSTPLAVGGKVSSGGAAIVDNSDQFNGMVDDVFFALLPRA